MHFGHLASLWFSTFMCLYVPVGVLLIMGTLEDEWYIVTKPYKFTGYERIFYQPATKCVASWS